MAIIGTPLSAFGGAGKFNSGSAAPAYSSSATYLQGDLVTYAGGLFKAKNNISTPEAWNISHWEAAVIADYIEDILETLPEKADLVEGKVPNSQLPSYVDEVVEYSSVSSFPAEGESGKIYVALDTGISYRWSGSIYIAIHVGNTAGDVSYDEDATYSDGTVGSELKNQNQQIANLQQNKASKGSVATVAAEVSNIKQYLQAEHDYGFTDGQSPAYVQPVAAGAYSMADVRMIGGNTKAWNQQLKNGNFESSSNWTVGLVAFDNVHENVATMRVTYKGSWLNVNIYQNNSKFVIGNKYLFLGEINQPHQSDVYIGYPSDNTYVTSVLVIPANNVVENQWMRMRKIFTADKAGVRFRFGVTTESPYSIGDTYKIRNFGLIDLTKIFGSGNEPSTADDPRIAKIEAYLATHPAYNAGELVSAQTDKIVSVGKNLFDKDSEGIIRNKFLDLNNEGAETGWNGHCISDWIPINSANEYVYVNLNASGQTVNNAFYDSNKNFISGSWTSLGKIAIPTNAKYMRSSLYTSYIGGAYIIYGESGLATYIPYFEKQLDIPAGLRSLKSADDVYDELDFETVNNAFKATKKSRIDSADLSNFNWIYTSQENRYYAIIPKNNINIKHVAPSVKGKGIAEKYRVGTYFQATSEDDTIGWYLNGDNITFSCKVTTAPTGMLYFERETYEETDVTDQFPETFSQSLPVERGGTVTFEQTGGTEIPIPNQVRYAVKLSDTL